MVSMVYSIESLASSVNGRRAADGKQPSGGGAGSGSSWRDSSSQCLIG
jgi:hypothetical protein